MVWLQGPERSCSAPLFLGTKLVYLGTLLYLAAACLWFALRLLFDAAGRCRAVSGCCAGAVRPAVRPVPGLSLNHYVQDVYVPMSGEDQEAYEKSLAIPGVVDKDRAKANARLEQAAKSTWLGDLIETQPVVKS